MPKKNSPNKNSSKLLVIILGIVALAASAVAGYAWSQLTTLRHNKQNADHSAEQAQYPVPIFAPLDTFTVSLAPVAGEEDDGRALYVGVTLRLGNAHSDEMLKTYLPEARSRLLMLFSQQTAAELSTVEGKEALRQKIKDVLSKPFAGQQAIVVNDVLYNVFILR